MARSTSRRRIAGATVLALTTATALLATPAFAGGSPHPIGPKDPGKKGSTTWGGYQNLVVIYQENHSFDNLYGTWGRVGGQRVDGIANATPANTTQIGQDGKPLATLPQNDVNLAPYTFFNAPFTVDDFIAAGDKTCPPEGASAPNGMLKDAPGALPGGCTRDLVHRFYQEKFQINGGQQNQYALGSDAQGLVMGVYNTKTLPIYQYLHAKGAPNYVVMDRFFQAANGGSFLNHQFLIAGRAPYDASNGAMGTANSVVDRFGMPGSTPLYTSPDNGLADKQLTVKCADGSVMDYLKACGNIAVNTVQPAVAPFGSGGKIALVDDATFPNIGDTMTKAGVSWNWYSGGWDAAASGNPGPLFQFHHQPFNYFADYAPGQPGRAHLQDETKFFDAAKAGTLPQVSFVKPYGAENEHPGYASEPDGSDHLVKLIDSVLKGPQAKDTLVVVTYDEFGGQWDHVAPPGIGSPTKGGYDAWGPGTRIPALAISARMAKSGVDHTVYDTTSIIRTIEAAWGLPAIETRKVNDLRNAISLGGSSARPRR